MTDKTEAPERIWAYAGTFKMWRDHKTDAPHTQTEYTRADLSDAKDERIAELEAKLTRTIGYKEDYAAAFVSVTEKLQQQGDRCDELEAKLAKAVAALGAWKSAGSDLDYYQAVQKRNATLAEIKGTTNDQ